VRAGAIAMMKYVPRALLVSVVTAVAFFALLAVMAVWATRNQETIRGHVVDAIARGVMTKPVSLGPFDRYPQPNQQYNCLLFSMMVAPADNLLIDAMSNRFAMTDLSVNDPRMPEVPFCQDLLRALPELGGEGWERVRWMQYDNYILGTRVLGRLLLSVMTVEAMGLVLLSTGYGLLLMIGIVALYRLSRSERDSAARQRAAGSLAMVGCFALFYGFSYFGSTLYYGPLDCTHFAFILISLFAPLADLRPLSLAVYASAYGSLVAMFEFLNGGIPVALAILPLLLALGFKGEWRAYVAKLTILWGCFCVAVIVSFALKKHLALVFLGDTVLFLGRLVDWMHGPDLNVLGSGYGTLDALVSLITLYGWYSRIIAWGSSRLGNALVVVALVTVLTVGWRRRTTLWRFDPPMMAALLSVASLIVWITVFFNHTIAHPFYQARLLVIPILAASVLAVTEALARGIGDNTSGIK
jgi:hypothetical protein